MEEYPIYTNGNLITESLPGSKHKSIVRDFIVEDSKGLEWIAKTGDITDGKSVPPWLHFLIGDPFEGVTEEAAVIHDRYCILNTRSQEDTHRIFREITLKEMKEKFQANKPLENSFLNNIKYKASIAWSFTWRHGWQYRRAWIMYYAVVAWNRNKKENKDWK